MSGKLVQQIFTFFGATTSQLPFDGTLTTEYCLPSQPCYPSQESFKAFNLSINGNLIRPIIPPFPCSTKECHSDEYRGNQNNSVMFLNFETGWNSTNFLLNSTRKRIPEYVVKAITYNDVVETVNFARENKLRLRIKNTGHDYLGRSSDEGTLTLWTHHLTSITFHPTFIPHLTPQDSSYTPSKALAIQAGVQMNQFYEAADENGVIVTGGVSKSVGAAGGYVLGGGHGPLAPLLGLACDNVLEFTVVLSNGEIVKASQFSHSELFQALKGGGGAFAAVLEVVYKAHEPPSGFIGVFGTFSIDPKAVNGVEIWRELIRKWIEIQPDLGKAGFAGYSYVRQPLPTPFAYILPSNDLELAKSTFAPFLNYLQSKPEIIFESKFIETKSFYELWKGEFQEALHSLDAVGINLLLGGRLIPKDIVENQNSSIALADFLSSSKSPAIVHLVAGGAVARGPEIPSSVNSLWRDTLLHIDLPVSWKDTASAQDIKNIESYVTAKTLALGQLALFSGGQEGAYPSEGDYNEKDWQRIWYGEENYSNLLKIKQMYDPEGVFTARKAVGSEIVGY